MILLPLKIFTPFFSCHSSFAFSFVTFLNLFNQILFEIVFAGAKGLLVGCLYLWNSFLNPFSVIHQILSPFTHCLEIESINICVWKCKLFLDLFCEWWWVVGLVAGMGGGTTKFSHILMNFICMPYFCCWFYVAIEWEITLIIKLVWFPKGQSFSIRTLPLFTSIMLCTTF